MKTNMKIKWPPSFLLRGTIAMQSGLCFLLLVRESAVDYRTDPKSLAFASVITFLISLGLLSSEISYFSRFRRTVAFLHFPAIAALPIVMMIANIGIGMFLFCVNAWNIVSLLLTRCRRKHGFLEQLRWNQIREEMQITVKTCGLAS